MSATQRNPLFEDDEPPAYSLRPHTHEVTLDSGAGTAVVRDQPAHLVLNPSDPRSQYTRMYNSGTASNAGPPLPQRTNAPSARHPPRTHTSLPQIRQAHIHSGPATSSGVRYSTLRDHPTAVRLINNSATLLGSRLRGTQPTGPSQASLYTVMCPTCRNIGWQSSRVPCTCPVGTVVKAPHQSRTQSSFLNFIDDLLGPHPGMYESPSATTHTRAPLYLHHVPGPGNPCPNCHGQSYFRNSEVRNGAVARDIRGRLGRSPPPCDVCGDRGRIN